MGVWAQVLAAVQQDAALHTLLVDLTTVRAHQHASGAQKNGLQALGRRRGGLTSKRQVVADVHGRFVRGSLTASLPHNAPQALSLLEGLAPAYLIADRSYDSNPLVTTLAERGAGAVIPPRRTARTPRAYAIAQYAQRRPVEQLLRR